MREPVPIHVRVLYFGQARQAAGTGAEEYSLPNASSVRALVSASMKAHQLLRAMPASTRIAVNEEIARDDDRLSDGDIVAFLPPVAGG